MNKLTKSQRDAFKLLERFSKFNLLKDEDPNFDFEITRTEISQLKTVLGIEIPLIHQNDVEEVYRTRSEPISVEITYGLHYMIGGYMKMYMPHQIKKLKDQC
ncbi:hypothetical protein AB4648_20025 [Vibrio splendidus]